MCVCLKQSKQLIASLSQPFKADGTKKEVVIARDCSLTQAISQMSLQKCSLESWIFVLKLQSPEISGAMNPWWDHTPKWELLLQDRNRDCSTTSRNHYCPVDVPAGDKDAPRIIFWKKGDNSQGGHYLTEAA